MNKVNTSPVVLRVVKNSVAYLYLDNPPVNALSHAVRLELVDAIRTMAGCSKVNAIVITGAGKAFCCGADIAEFGGPSKSPDLNEMLSVVEASEKPVIAAMNGLALGGGLELGLACDYRLVALDAKLGLPEVTLGIIPGAGGTQRLPRLVGPKSALNIIVWGRAIAALEALNMGLVDSLAVGNFEKETETFLAQLCNRGLRKRRVSGQNVEAVDSSVYYEMRKLAEERLPHQEAPLRAIESIRAAETLPFSEGLKREHAIFSERLNSTQSRALRHIFFAERQASKILQNGIAAEVREIREAAVVGAGAMGTGIALAFADAGIRTILLDLSPSDVARGLKRVEEAYASSVKRDRISAQVAADRISLISGSTSYGDVGRADLAVEAVFERMETKKRVFEGLDTHLKRGALLATNTSYLNLDVLASHVSRPKDVVGLHFFNPANVMKLLEIVRGQQTSISTLASAVHLSKRINKIAVIAGVCHGFIGNRMLQRYFRESGRLLLEGASPSEIDAALVNFGMPMGPFALVDLAGLDIGHAMRSTLGSEIYDIQSFAPFDRLVGMGRLGQKSSAGFYRYEMGSRTPFPDPIVSSLINELSEKFGVRKRHIKPDEIVDRCILSLANEGMHIVDEGIAQRAGDVDAVYVHGYGFPRYLGGPLYYAQSRGVGEVLKRIREFGALDDQRWWQPSLTLERAAAVNGSLYSVEV
jgi:3-hydroxyacyl-CoA dehydrogenase